jgi:DNA-binding IclR family transcriptional regulator
MGESFFLPVRVVAPVFAQPDGEVVGSIGVTAITSDIVAAELEQLCAEVKRSAQTLSQKIVN